MLEFAFIFCDENSDIQYPCPHVKYNNSITNTAWRGSKLDPWTTDRRPNKFSRFALPQLDIEIIKNKGLILPSHIRNSKCNRIRGATEGTVFPPDMETGAVFRVFRKAFCRPVPIVFKGKVEREGLPAFHYSLPDNFADPDNPENACYCRGGECPRKGLMDLTPCYYSELRAPLFVYLFTH